MNRMNKLNHFTTYDVLESIITNGLKFSTSFDGWEDKNDSKLVEIYKEITHNDNVGIICFLNDDETIYHWIYFAKNKERKDVCCIELAKKELLEEYMYHSLYRCQEVQYDVLKEVSFDDVEELLFTKRYPYRNESEYRIVSLNGGYLPINGFIRKITLSPYIDDSKFQERKRKLMELGVKCDINHSTVLENKQWIFQAELLRERCKMKSFDTKPFYCLKNDEIEQIQDFVQRHNIALPWDNDYKNSYVTRMFQNKQLIGLARAKSHLTRDLSAFITPHVCKLSEELLSINKKKVVNELDIIAIDEQYAGNESYNLLIRALLSVFDEGVFFTSMNMDDKESDLEQVLVSIGFKVSCEVSSRNKQYVFSSLKML